MKPRSFQGAGRERIFDFAATRGTDSSCRRTHLHRRPPSVSGRIRGRGISSTRAGPTHWP